MILNSVARQVNLAWNRVEWPDGPALGLMPHHAMDQAISPLLQSTFRYGLLGLLTHYLRRSCGMGGWAGWKERGGGGSEGEGTCGVAAGAAER
jgi:hypothetical protein